ncbi:MAG TPA: hypothetical protein VEJ21_01775 [Acidimicrobiales bacterium]|nr:hypothetical protein [Acidimicrobiales bacterium]
MRRKTFDMLATVGGGMLTIVLIAAGSLGLWAASWTNSNVHNQLAEQKITFPAAAAFQNAKVGTEITPSMIPSVSQYAGQQLLTGPQAEAYADDFIAVHLQEIGGGLTYSQLSAKAMALPKGTPAYTAAEAQVQTVFQGTTLRGLLLEAYGFWKFGQIALVGAIIAFVLAGIMLVLSLFGVWHYSRTPEEVEFPKSLHHEGKVPAGV